VPTSRTVPFFNYPELFARHEEEMVATFRDVGSRGAFIMQRDLEEFEAHLAEFLGVAHAFGVADGSNAITLALIASGIQPGDEVILPSHTFIATGAAVHAAGAVPVLADCGPDHMLDVDSARTAITSKTRCIMPVQLNGRTCQMDQIAALASEHGLVVVEDAAQALGARFRDQCAGTFGSAGTFSFYPAKLLGCLGDGGAVVTNDNDVAEQLFMLRDHGRDRDGNIRRWGFNSRLDNLQAAFLDKKLKRFEGEIARRREIAGLYDQALGDLAQLQLPPAPGQPGDDRFDVYQNYELEAADRDSLREHLSAGGIGTMIQWGGTPLHAFKDLGFTEVPPYTEAMFGRCLMLPLNTSMSNEDIEYVIAAVRSFYGD
jgi:dTDP-4-amino-4,6-dideoxygalactose transaminase